MWFDLFLIFIFVLINGFFAASEIAIITTRRSRIKQLMDEGRKNAGTLHKLREDPDRLLATVQVGVTLAGSIAAAIGGAAAIKNIQPILKDMPVPFISASSEIMSISFVVIVIAYISLVFGELIPKSIALSNPETIGMLTAPIIDRFSRLATIFVKLLTLSTNFLLKPFGKKASTGRGYISEEEVKLLLEEGREQGVFEHEEKKLIHSVFEFTDTSVKEVMIPATRMLTIGISMTADEARAIISEEKFSRYPVIGKGVNDIRGILYSKDFFNILFKTGNVEIHRIIKPPIFIPETMKISILLREMQKKRVHMAIVIDEYGAVSGLVTLEDLLEEIVGEIRDEYDTESPVIQLSDGSMIIDASLSIHDLKDDYEIEIPESDEYETLGGFILTYLQRIPQSGDTIELDHKKLKIVEMVGQRVSKVKLEKIDNQ